MKARIRGLTFDGGPGFEGFYINRDEFTGWYDGTSTRQDQTDIPQAHGAFDAPGFRASRVVSISGECFASNRQKLTWFGAQLTGLLADGGSDRLVVEDEDGSLWADVRLTGATKFIPAPWGTVADYQIQFWAADPRLYGDTRTFVSGDAAYHFGNFPADPVFTVAGPRVGGYTINGPDNKKFTVTQDPGAGHTHTIDMSTGLVYLDGVVQSGVVSRADTWTIPGGVQVVMSISSGAMSVAVTDTFI